MNTYKKVGIWGFGRVGKSVAQFLHAQGYTLSVMSKDPLSADESRWIQDHAIPVYTQDEKEYFFTSHDHIIPSPGINIRPYYQAYKHKWITELDLFYDTFKKPIIAVTGTVGKTTVTYLLDQIFTRYGLHMCAGGNIGIPMSDLLNQQDTVEYALLEVSSFQLEYVERFAPSFTIWTNLSPNHLDRHTTYEDYFNAKYQSIAHQKNTDKALVPLTLAHTIKNKNPKSKIYYLHPKTPSEDELNMLDASDLLFFIEDNQIKKRIGSTVTSLCALALLPDITFADNWLVICSALDILGLPVQKLYEYTHNLAIPAHRMEKICVRDIIFYNDSKSTTTTSTYAALQKLEGESIILFVGGLSKGVNRSDFIKTLQNKVKYIYCFGAEAEILNGYCAAYGIASHAFSTLDDAFNACMQTITTQDCVLFSPAGSSYDLFKDYEDRGNYFKKLVLELDQSKSHT